MAYGQVAVPLWWRGMATDAAAPLDGGVSTERGRCVVPLEKVGLHQFETVPCQFCNQMSQKARRSKIFAKRKVASLAYRLLVFTANLLRFGACTVQALDGGKN